ncbi:hypothetical protein ABZT47_11815 [Sphaerisporangium sp. NPDC005289]|uniref:hypothetical protein n=1 Tax=Sphaerisporangium sp. NPDC005289 TaxID=3155247 RepID=UPI0033AE6776
MRASLFTTTAASAALLAALVAATPAQTALIQAAAAHAATTSAVRARCSGLSCTFSFSPATTATMKRAADRADWLSGPAADIICARIPNRLVALGCAVALVLPYNNARKRLTEAYAKNGCFAVKAELGHTLPIRFAALSPGHPYCD